MLGPDGALQLEWLDDTLASATSQWRIVRARFCGGLEPELATEREARTSF
jgi:phosphodiesterase/alkaline phosphatase D-like protein